MPIISRRVSRWLVAAYLTGVVLIIIMADLGHCPLDWRLVPHGDKIGHFLLIGAAALALNIALGCRRVGRGRLSVFLGSMVIALLATLEELSQRYVHTRSCSAGDLMADLAGILLAGLLLAWVLRRRAAAATTIR